jgi:hypothetical protein
MLFVILLYLSSKEEFKMFGSILGFFAKTIVQAVVTAAVTIAGMLVVAQQMVNRIQDNYYTDFEPVY